jgi:hypothetical protein
MTPARTVPDLARQWFEAQSKDGLFSPKLDQALLKALATSVADVVALLLSSSTISRSCTVSIRATSAGSVTPARN